MLKKLLNIKVPTLFDDRRQQGTIRTEWQSYLFMIIALFVVPVFLIIAYFNYWI